MRSSISRFTILVIIVLGLVVVQANVFAQDAQNKKDQPKQTMAFPPMPMMLPPTSPALQVLADGSVVILAGNRLMKFDKDFKLVNDVTLMERSPEVKS